MVSVPEDLPFQFIREITDDFSEERILGQGAFGVVYRCCTKYKGQVILNTDNIYLAGVTKDGHDVAVKKLKPCLADLGNKQFRNEFDTLTELNHQNIVKLSGKDNQANEIQVVHSSLTELLPGKNIMIVLDDLWEDNQFQLKDLQDMLYHDDSKIIISVTTRSESVAERICANLQPYKILPLTNDMCWDIIKQRSGFRARGDKEKLTGFIEPTELLSVMELSKKYIMQLRGLSFFQESPKVHPIFT
ncbi:unnamed protein product [Miscanthus lutarioriparius]|uniref:Protein kinase domain-containing protein n=1 Tax=Miscanthus lutarioriparius TaxID=422564 RepID=A0A811QDA5_9POAL|nr:unnamed protein product [Miscanthus lutarioriparius]